MEVHPPPTWKDQMFSSIAASQEGIKREGKQKGRGGGEGQARKGNTKEQKGKRKQGKETAGKG